MVSDERFNPELQYRCVAGRPWNSLVAMAAHLVDAPAGAGGFCVVKGSHKLNFALPPECVADCVDMKRLSVFLDVRRGVLQPYH